MEHAEQMRQRLVYRISGCSGDTDKGGGTVNSRINKVSCKLQKTNALVTK